MLITKFKNVYVKFYTYITENSMFENNWKDMQLKKPDVICNPFHPPKEIL